MKGNFVQNGLLWEITIQGEKWYQGEKISGSLTILNQNSSTMMIEAADVKLCFADFKKVFANDLRAFKVEQEQNFKTNLELAPKQKEQLDFNFSLSDNAPISDKKSSYYLTYGDSINRKHLQLNIVPRIQFTKVSELLENFYRFKCQEIKNVKGGVEFKYNIPSARDLTGVESLSLIQKIDNDKLNCEFTFVVNKLDLAAMTTKTKKESKIFNLILTPKEYLLTKEMLNQEFLLKKLDEIIAQIKIKGFFLKDK